MTALESEQDVWVATADGDGRPHLVPLSLCWDGERLILQVRRYSRTARNAISSGQARVAVGTTRHVVVIDAAVTWTPVVDSPEIAALYQERTRWDVSRHAAHCVFLLLAPQRIQAWRELSEFGERTLMSNGRWIV